MTQIKKDLYLHADCETTSLKSHTGRLWQLGAVATLADYTSPPDTDNLFNISMLPHPDNWDPDTFKWAQKTYGQDFAIRCVEEGILDYRIIWNDIAAAFTRYVEYLEARGYIVHIICNHTDFDITFLKVMYDKINMKFPIKYNRIWDMPSLLVATAKMSASDCMAAIGQSKANVAHTGLKDAIAQMEVLKRYNVYLPPSSKD